MFGLGQRSESGPSKVAGNYGYQQLAQASWQKLSPQSPEHPRPDQASPKQPRTQKYFKTAGCPIPIKRKRSEKLVVPFLCSGCGKVLLYEPARPSQWQEMMFESTPGLDDMAPKYDIVDRFA